MLFAWIYKHIQTHGSLKFWFIQSHIILRLISRLKITCEEYAVQRFDKDDNDDTKLNFAH